MLIHSVTHYPRRHILGTSANYTLGPPLTGHSVRILQISVNYYYRKSIERMNFISGTASYACPTTSRTRFVFDTTTKHFPIRKGCLWPTTNQRTTTVHIYAATGAVLATKTISLRPGPVREIRKFSNSRYFGEILKCRYFESAFSKTEVFCFFNIISPCRNSPVVLNQHHRLWIYPYYARRVESKCYIPPRFNHEVLSHTHPPSKHPSSPPWRTELAIAAALDRRFPCPLFPPRLYPSNQSPTTTTSSNELSWAQHQVQWRSQCKEQNLVSTCEKV